MTKYLISLQRYTRGERGAQAAGKDGLEGRRVVGENQRRNSGTCEYLYSVS